ncbi:MAG: hypothetical protein ABL966_04985 [Acidimicrobiales bacterium]
MIRARAALVVFLLVATGCSGDEPGTGRPALGAAPGPVQLHPSGDVGPGATLIVDVRSTRSSHGGACITLDEWDDGWTTRWVWGHGDSTARPVEGEEVSCDAIGLPFPIAFPMDVPVDLEAGTWRLSHLGSTGSGLVFEVPR